MRAIERNECLPALKTHVNYLLAEGVAVPAHLSELQQQCLDKVWSLAEMAVRDKRSDLARQVSSAIYNAFTLAALRWEARYSGLETRAELADLVLVHKLAPWDPCVDSHTAQVSEALKNKLFSQNTGIA